MTKSSKVAKVITSAKQTITKGTDLWQVTAADEAELVEKNVHLPLRFDQLKRYLPHRYPFMLVDRVNACRSGDWIVGHKNVSINEPFFQGHFPEDPIMPGVLIVEALAQVSGILAFITEGKTAEDGYLFLFAGIDKVRFKCPVVPGDQLVLKSKLVTQRRHIYKFECQAFVDDKIVANADLTIVRQEREAK